jgi:hypothetical protein
MKLPVTLLIILCIAAQTEFIKNRTKEFQTPRCYHQDILIGRNLRPCCNTAPSRCTATHTAYTPVDDISKGTEGLSVIQCVTNVTNYRKFTSSAFIELLAIFFHLNPLNTANKLSCSSWDIPQAVVRVTAVPGVSIVCTADNATAFCHSTWYTDISFTVFWVLPTIWPKVYLKFCVICQCATKREVPRSIPVSSDLLLLCEINSLVFHSASNRNTYQGVSLDGKVRPTPRADSCALIFVLNVTVRTKAKYFFPLSALPFTLSV